MAESAQALSIQAKGEEGVIGSIARAVSESITEGLKWVYWWHSAVESPWMVSGEEIRYELNRNYRTESMGANDLQALVAAWQNGAISRDTLLHNLRVRELLPPGRTEEEEMKLIVEG